MVSRREFLQISSVAGAGLVLTGGWRLRRPAAQGVPLDPRTIRRYVQPLFAPEVIDATAGGFFEVPSREVQRQVLGLRTAAAGGGEFPLTTVWGYGGSYPGPTFEARVGTPITVKWTNELGPGPHLLPVDYTLHGAHDPSDPDDHFPDRRIVTHLHGGAVNPEDDGYPEAWYDYLGVGPAPRPGRPPVSDTFFYPNNQFPGPVWYHDHALGITRLNVYAGLAGFYRLRDPDEASLGLPIGLPYEVPLALQDRSFDVNGQLWYPDVGMNGVNPVWVPEFFGDVSVVNGRAWPFYEVEPRRYRLLILNGATSRFYNLRFYVRGPGGQLTQAGPVMIQIGTDGGYLPAPVNLATRGGNNPGRLLLGPGERADVVVDFAPFAGRTLVLHNNAPIPFAGSATREGGFGPYTGRRHFAGGAVPLTELMEFRVGTAATGNFEIPASLPSEYVDPGIAPGQLPAGVTVRVLELAEVLNAQGVPLMAVVRDTAGHQMWDQPLDGGVVGGSREVWLFVNTTADTHPMHLHLVQFRPLWRRAFNVGRFVLGQPIPYQGPAIPIDLNERGMKDTLRANPGEVTALLVDFPTGVSGYFPVHCHILEHEDHEMMREYLIGDS